MIETQSAIVHTWIMKSQDEVVVAIIFPSELPLAAVLSPALSSEHLTSPTSYIHTWMTLTLIDAKQHNLSLWSWCWRCQWTHGQWVHSGNLWVLEDDWGMYYYYSLTLFLGKNNAQPKVYWQPGVSLDSVWCPNWLAHWGSHLLVPDAGDAFPCSQYHWPLPLRLSNFFS